MHHLAVYSFSQNYNCRHHSVTLKSNLDSPVYPGIGVECSNEPIKKENWDSKGHQIKCLLEAPDGGALALSTQVLNCSSRLGHGPPVDQGSGQMGLNENEISNDFKIRNLASSLPLLIHL